MQASSASPLATYNSLTDHHLAEYFSNPRLLRHLRRMGLITKDGQVVEESVVRMKAARKEHKSRAQEVLASAIVQKAVELEKYRRAELKKKLEFLAKIEKVEKIKSQKRHPVGIQDFHPYPSPAYQPYRARHNPLGFSSVDHLLDHPQMLKTMSALPFQLEPPSLYSSPGRVTPVPRPPSTPKPHASATVRKRRSTVQRRPHTAPVMGKSSSFPQTVTRRAQVHSLAQITLCYVGKSLNFRTQKGPSKSEVEVLQQHCGGNTVTVFRGKVQPKEHFTFTSRRHLGMPFGLTIYVDGMLDCRLSACCEYRHSTGKLLGSKTAHFGLVKVEGGRPCYKCMVKEVKEVRENQATGVRGMQEPAIAEESGPLCSQIGSGGEDNAVQSSQMELGEAINVEEVQHKGELNELLNRYIHPHPPPGPPPTPHRSQGSRSVHRQPRSAGRAEAVREGPDEGSIRDNSPDSSHSKLSVSSQRAPEGQTYKKMTADSGPLLGTAALSGANSLGSQDDNHSSSSEELKTSHSEQQHSDREVQSYEDEVFEEVEEEEEKEKDDEGTVVEEEREEEGEETKEEEQKKEEGAVEEEVEEEEEEKEKEDEGEVVGEEREVEGEEPTEEEGKEEEEGEVEEEVEEDEDEESEVEEEGKEKGSRATQQVVKSHGSTADGKEEEEEAESPRVHDDESLVPTVEPPYKELPPEPTSTDTSHHQSTPANKLTGVHPRPTQLQPDQTDQQSATRDSTADATDAVAPVDDREPVKEEEATESVASSPPLQTGSSTNVQEETAKEPSRDLPQGKAGPREPESTEFQDNTTVSPVHGASPGPVDAHSEHGHGQLEKSDTLRSILLSSHREKTLSGTLKSNLSVSFGHKVLLNHDSDDELSSNSDYSPPPSPPSPDTPAEGHGDREGSATPLSATLTLEDAQNMLKSSSSYSLGSILNEKEVSYASTVEVSGSEDEDIPDLEARLSKITSEVGIPLSESGSPLKRTPPSIITQNMSQKGDDMIVITSPGRASTDQLEARDSNGSAELQGRDPEEQTHDEEFRDKYLSAEVPPKDVAISSGEQAPTGETAGPLEEGGGSRSSSLTSVSSSSSGSSSDVQ